MVTISRRFALVAASAAAVLSLAACGGSADASTGGSDSETLTFASIPSEESSSITEEYATVIEVIEAETGATVEMQNATDYAAVIEAQRAGQVQIARYGPFSYVTATDSGVESEILGVPVDTPDEEPGYRSYGIVPAGSDIKSLEDFEGKNVCFVDPTSTSGFLYPSAGLIEAGVDPENDVNQTFAGGHDASALSVADGTCDAGFAFDTMVDTELIESGQLEEGALEVIWESETIAASPTVVSTDVSDELREQLHDIFINKLNVDWLTENGYCDDAASCGLPGEYGYTQVEDDFYDGVRKVCDITEAESCVS
ncbi:phosphate/phosphite/phosphonate ABC transporter substrate-binding protein [Brevibacterium daeguense]|uniref:Phosphate/phosphite/phosphonate ABC transporter substrate-binding protein n=1 Tax=Brevibacterium daeguense TaxID=909936 RepID=A0ABP8EGE7_9MICO|nr:phosphate/phosphite/phosphonate ABC transporter substrate-binding protein [Brevibacterium daeguense]